MTKRHKVQGAMNCSCISGTNRFRPITLLASFSFRVRQIRFPPISTSANFDFVQLLGLDFFGKLENKEKNTGKNLICEMASPAEGRRCSK